MSALTAEVVICGAGIAGIAAAYHLAVRRGVTGIVLVDEGPPLSLTSDKSTECYRNWWPGPGDDMVALMNRSIDLLEELARESDNRFLLNRRGYLFVTADPTQVPMFIERAREAAERGGRPLRRAGGANARPRSAGVLRAAREGRVQRFAGRGAALGADDDLDRSDHAPVVRRGAARALGVGGAQAPRRGAPGGRARPARGRR